MLSIAKEKLKSSPNYGFFGHFLSDFDAAFGEMYIENWCNFWECSKNFRHALLN